MDRAVSRVLVADRHQNMLEGVRGLLTTMFDVVVMVADEVSLLDSIELIHPDLTVIDLSLMPNSVTGLTQRLQKKHPELKIILLSVHDEKTVADACLNAGAMGVVLKRSVTNDLIPAVLDVQKGRNYLSPALNHEH